MNFIQQLFCNHKASCEPVSDRFGVYIGSACQKCHRFWSDETVRILMEQERAREAQLTDKQKRILQKLQKGEIEVDVVVKGLPYQIYMLPKKEQIEWITEHADIILEE